MAKIQTVLGPIDSSELGITLMHEHLFLDRTPFWKDPDERFMHLAYKSLQMNMLGTLRLNPYINKDNGMLTNSEEVIEEVAHFYEHGGRTVVDVTTKGLGNNPIALREVSLQTGLNIVMGTGFYLHDSHPGRVRESDEVQLAEEMVRDIEEGVDQTNIRAGIIGEIGISPEPTDQELKVLRAAAQAQKATDSVLSIHLPGWKRLGHTVLDQIEREGGNVNKTILCHMNPSWKDYDYQDSLAERGCFLEFDMIGIEYYFPGEGQSPSDEENARAVIGMIERGYDDRILLSQDVFLKMMWKRYGGWGYSHILENFVPRLKRMGLTDDDIQQLLVTNPRSVFEA